MNQNRRDFLRLLASGVIGTIASAELDIDRLLWVPGEKTISIPSGHLSEAQIVATELERISSQITSLFYRDDTFYDLLSEKTPILSSREMCIPLIIEPGKK